MRFSGKKLAFPSPSGKRFFFSSFFFYFKEQLAKPFPFNGVFGSVQPESSSRSRIVLASPWNFPLLLVVVVSFERILFEAAAPCFDRIWNNFDFGSCVLGNFFHDRRASCPHSPPPHCGKQSFPSLSSLHRTPRNLPFGKKSFSNLAGCENTSNRHSWLKRYAATALLSRKRRRAFVKLSFKLRSRRCYVRSARDPPTCNDFNLSGCICATIQQIHVYSGNGGGKLSTTPATVSKVFPFLEHGQPNETRHELSFSRRYHLDDSSIDTLKFAKWNGFFFRLLVGANLESETRIIFSVRKISFRSRERFLRWLPTRHRVTVTRRSTWRNRDRRDR